ncbi:hypothetical protein YC2023_082459 [Brassica napus]
MISDLPRDLAERVLSRLPVTSLKGVRSTCKNWKALSIDMIDLERLGNPSRQASLFLFSFLLSRLSLSPRRRSLSPFRRAAASGGGGCSRLVVVTRSRLSLVPLFQICSDLISLVSCSRSRSRLRWSVLNPIYSHDSVYSFMLELGLSSPCLRARFIEHVIVRMIDECIMMHKNTHTDKWDLMNCVPLGHPQEIWGSGLARATYGARKKSQPREAGYKKCANRERWNIKTFGC